MNLRTTLFDHQRPPVEKLLRSRVAGLFMQMGTGKTRVAIELAYLRRERIDKVIWFCPVSLKETIRQEIQKHTAGSVIYVFDDKTSKRNVPAAFWYIVGIETMSSSDRVTLAVASLITSSTMVIVDESSYIKGHNARRTQRITRLAEKARYRLLLTGTPMSQGVIDLYAQMRFLSPKILGYGSFYSFARNHLEYSEKYPGMVVRAHNLGWLAAKIQPYVYQITKEEAGLMLPPKRYDARYFELTRAQWAAYNWAKEEILLSADEIDSYVIFQLFTALQQVASGFWNHEGQLLEFECWRPATLVGVIKALPAGARVIVWCKYHYSLRRVIGRLAAEYGEAAVTEFRGGLSERQRNKELARFRAEARFFVATAGTAGHGLTLNEAHYMIFYENEFKYANRLQAEDRCHRIGQEQRVTYIDLWGDCKIEQRIRDSHAKKGNAIDDFRRKVQAIKDKKGKELRAAVADLL